MLRNVVGIYREEPSICTSPIPPWRLWRGCDGTITGLNRVTSCQVEASKFGTASIKGPHRQRNVILALIVENTLGYGKRGLRSKIIDYDIAMLASIFATLTKTGIINDLLYLPNW